MSLIHHYATFSISVWARILLQLWSAPAKTDGSFHLNFVCAFGIIFAAQVRLENKNIVIWVSQNGIRISICSETVPCFDGSSHDPCSANNTREFCQSILPSASNECRTCWPSPTPSCPCQWQQTVSNVHCTAAHTFRLFNIIFIAFRPVNNAVTITHISNNVTATIRSASSASLRYSTSKTNDHQWHGRSRCI